LDEWPLDIGEYRAVLSRNAEGDDDTTLYDIYAASEIFVVVGSTDLCVNNPQQPEPTTPSPTSNPLPASPAPTQSPTPAPSLQSTPAPTLPPSSAPTPPPTSAQTPSPTPQPTLASQPPTLPKRMAQVILTAKQEISQLIFVDPKLSAVFLRMIFNDCIGGCDGCINLIENPNNRGLRDGMKVLREIVINMKDSD
jgi:hypothetical protein